MPEGQVLEFTHVTKRFNNVTAVSDLSVRVEPGVVTGFLGPNGAGKTTTLRMLLGQIRPTSGTATIGGVSYAELRHPLRTIGAVLEESAYRPRRTAARQLLIAAKANGIPIERVGEVLRLVGLLDDADTRIGGYSLGMRQRLSVATALLGDPGALVLDEPANGLDPEGIRWMRLLMRRLADEGRTVLVSSHVLSEIEQVADHVVVLSKGRSVYAGSIEDLADPSTGAVVVDAEDRDALVGALRAGGLSFDVLRSGVTVRDSDAAAVGAIAASAGIALTTLQQRGPSLEEVFLDLVYGRRADSPRLDKDANPVAHAPNPTEAVTTVPAGDAALAASGVAGAGVAGAAIVAGADAAADAESADAADAEVVSGDAADEASGEDETAAAETAAADGEAAAESDDAQPETVEATEAEAEAEAEAGDVESTEATEADETAESADEAESAEGAEDAEDPAAESADDAEATEEPETTDEPEPTEESEQAAETETDADTTIADAEAADDEPSIEEASADGAEDEVSEQTTSEDHATDESDSDQPDAETEDDTTAAETQPESTDHTPTRRFPLPGEWAPRAAQGSPAASDNSSPTVLPLATEAVSLPVTTEPASFTELITGIPAAAEGDGAEPATTTSSFQIISPVLPTEDDDEESVDDADDPRLAAMRTSLSAAASRFFGGPAPDYPYGDVPKRDEPRPGETENSESSENTEDEATRVIDTVEPASENPENPEHDNGEQHHG